MKAARRGSSRLSVLPFWEPAFSPELLAPVATSKCVRLVRHFIRLQRLHEHAEKHQEKEG